MSYESQKKLVIAFLCLYFATGMYFGNQVYPFFGWTLFATIPNEQKDYTLELLSYDGIVYDPAVPFSGTRFLFNVLGQSPTQYTQRISELGSALERGDAAVVKEQRLAIERIFKGKTFSYAILEVRYDPIELWRTGMYRDRHFITSFDSEHAP